MSMINRRGPGPSVLELTGLSKTFPGVRALREVDLRIGRGEVHALVGQNGSGKSTLIKVLAGVHSPDPGARAQVEGRELRLGDPGSAHEVGIRFVHQDLGLIPNLSAIDNLALGFGYPTGLGGRIKWSDQRERAATALGYVVQDFPLKQDVGSLSVFHKTALAIARALQDWREHGSLLVLDEPTAAMPRAQVEHLFDLLDRIRNRGTSVLLVTHHLEEVFAVSDRVTVLRDGAVVADEPSTALDAAGLTALMTGTTDAASDKRQREAPGEPVLELAQVAGSELRGLDLTVRAGEIVGVAGLSGSGRDELCELVFGARPRTGSITVAGKTLKPRRPDQSVAAGVGLVPAHRHRDGLILTESVRRNLTLAGLSEFRSAGRIRARAERRSAATWIKRLRVKTASSEVPIASLSGGNQQKVVIGKWLRIAPRVLLLDEPTQGVDVGAQADLHSLLVEAASAGTALLVCSSDELELSRLCDRVVVLQRGVAFTELVGDEVTAERIVSASLAAPTDPSTAPPVPAQQKETV